MSRPRHKSPHHRTNKALRYEVLERRELMAADFDPRYFIDRRDFGGPGEVPLVGDFNGDRLADIGVYVPNGSKDARWVIKFNQGNGRFADGARYNIDRRDMGGVGETPLVGDFNGDGRADIGVYVPKARGGARWVVKLNTGNGQFASKYYIDRTDIGGVGESPLVADFNGDGRADIGVYVPKAGGGARWVVKLNTGNGQFASRYYIDRSDIGGAGETPLVADFNADGKADIGVYVPNASRDARWVAKFHQGDGRFATGAHYDIDRRNIGGTGETPLAGDFNGDRRADIGVYVANGSKDARWVVKTNVAVATYMLQENFGGRWWDAEKAPGNDGVGETSGARGADDDLMCWAASASNVLAWTGWGNVAGMSNPDQIFDYFSNRWTDQGGSTAYAWQWWFSGVNPSQGWQGWSQVDVAGGGFFGRLNLGNYFTSNINPAQALNAIDGNLHAARGVALSISLPGAPIGHVITCWGYDYEPANPGRYRGIYVTDSDDNMAIAAPPDQLRYYNVQLVNGQWCLQDYGGNSAWCITGVYGLARRPAMPIEDIRGARETLDHLRKLPFGMAAGETIALASQAAPGAGIISTVQTPCTVLSSATIAAAAMEGPHAPQGLPAAVLTTRHEASPGDDFTWAHPGTSSRQDVVDEFYNRLGAGLHDADVTRMLL